MALDALARRLTLYKRSCSKRSHTATLTEHSYNLFEMWVTRASSPRRGGQETSALRPLTIPWGGNGRNDAIEPTRKLVALSLARSENDTLSAFSTHNSEAKAVNLTDSFVAAWASPELVDVVLHSRLWGSVRSVLIYFNEVLLLNFTPIHYELPLNAFSLTVVIGGALLNSPSDPTTCKISFIAFNSKGSALWWKHHHSGMSKSHFHRWKPLWYLWLVMVNIESRRSYLCALECLDESLLVDHLSTSGINQPTVTQSATNSSSCRLEWYIVSRSASVSAGARMPS